MHEQLEGRLDGLRSGPTPPPAAFLASVRRRRQIRARARLGVATLLTVVALAVTARLWLRPSPLQQGSPGLMARVAGVNGDDLASVSLMGRVGSGFEAGAGSLGPADVFRAGDGLWAGPDTIDRLLGGV